MKAVEEFATLILLILLGVFLLNVFHGQGWTWVKSKFLGAVDPGASDKVPAGDVQGLVGMPLSSKNPLTGQPYGGVVQTGIKPQGTLQ
jgi:hypothetical protein